MIRRVLRRLGVLPAPTRHERMAASIDELRRSGMHIGNNVAIYNCVLDTNFPFLIRIGDDCIVTHATLLAHDASPTVYGMGVVVGEVRIGSRCFIGAGAVVMPGVSVGDDCVIGAATVVTKDVPAGSVVAGNPARVVSTAGAWRARLASGSRRRLLIPVEQGSLVPSEAEAQALARDVRARFLHGDFRANGLD